MQIKIYGTGTSGTKLVRDLIEFYLNKANIIYDIKEITDVYEFLNHDIHSVPAVQVNEDSPIDVKSNGNFNRSIRNIICNMLEKEKFGTLSRILVPIDFSDASINAFSFANKLSQENGHLLTLAHIYYPTSVDINGTVFYDANLREEKKKMLTELVEGINQDWIGDFMKASLVTGKFGEGFPVPKLLEMAKEDNSEFVVIGSTGSGSSLKHLFGSVSTELMLKADRPVFIVPPKAQYRPFNNILFAASNANEDLECINYITTFFADYASHIHVVHVESSENHHVINEEYKNMWTEKYPAEKLSFRNLTGNDITTTINAYADEKDINLLVVHPQKRPFFKRIFHKSISKKLAISCSIPILAIHTP